MSLKQNEEAKWLQKDIEDCFENNSEIKIKWNVSDYEEDSINLYKAHPDEDANTVWEHAVEIFGEYSADIILQSLCEISKKHKCEIHTDPNEEDCLIVYFF